VSNMGKKTVLTYFKMKQ